MKLLILFVPKTTSTGRKQGSVGEGGGGRQGGRGVATGVYIGIYTPKIAQVNFYGVKMTSEQLFNSFIPPKLLYPKTN